jgi:hypothetical protein
MATLGAIFPKLFRDKVAAKVVPGAVVYTVVQFPDGRERQKYIVIGHVQQAHDVALCFLINKEKHPTLVEAVPAINACQVETGPATETFLPQECFIGCEKVRAFPHSALVDEVRGEPSLLKGTLCAATIAKVIEAVKAAPTISADHKKQIVDSLTSKP